MNSRKDSRIKVGKIVSAVGIGRGGKGLSLHGLSSALRRADCVYAGDEKLQIEKVRYQKNVVIVKFSGSDDRNRAEAR